MAVIILESQKLTECLCSFKKIPNKLLKTQKQNTVFSPLPKLTLHDEIETCPGIIQGSSISTHAVLSECVSPWVCILAYLSHI